jgi:hypothetical protein
VDRTANWYIGGCWFTLDSKRMLATGYSWGTPVYLQLYPVAGGLELAMEHNQWGRQINLTIFHSQPSSKTERALHGWKVDSFIYVEEESCYKKIALISRTNRNVTHRWVCLLVDYGSIIALFWKWGPRVNIRWPTRGANLLNIVEVRECAETILVIRLRSVTSFWTERVEQGRWKLRTREEKGENYVL